MDAQGKGTTGLTCNCGGPLTLSGSEPTANGTYLYFSCTIETCKTDYGTFIETLDSLPGGFVAMRFQRDEGAV